MVFDLVVTPDRDAPGGYAIQVMDLNPFGPETSTGLFRWGANDLDGSFRCFR